MIVIAIVVALTSLLALTGSWVMGLFGSGIIPTMIVISVLVTVVFFGFWIFSLPTGILGIPLGIGVLGWSWGKRLQLPQN